MRTHRTAALLLTACTCLVAHAQVYRCGDTYSQQPCPGGRQLETPPVPTAAEQREAERSTQRQARAAQDLQAERLRLEARPNHLYVPPPRMEPGLDPYKTPEKKATQRLEVFTASVPGSKPPKKDKAAPKKP
jgi:hypothetical protein